MGSVAEESWRGELLDGIDFDRYGKVKCRAIELLMPQLMKMEVNKGI